MWDCLDMEKEVITIRRTFSCAGCNNLQEFTKTSRIRYLPALAQEKSDKKEWKLPYTLPAQSGDCS
jgi:hypothetical protein